MLGAQLLDPRAAQPGVHADALEQRECPVAVRVEVLGRLPDLEDLEILVAEGGVVQPALGLRRARGLELPDQAPL
jgi:hypothetical protein